MIGKLEIGKAGGPQYNVARAIKSFLDQMAEKNIILGAAVIKELMQNADDARATEISVILDERVIPEAFEKDFRQLLQPALLIHNNAPFQYEYEKKDGSRGDFDALCDVASGHKRAQAVSAGRFGIGFNSVYFLTDTPVIFSRREVHIFDPTHQFIVGNNGWRFTLDEFPSSASSAGPIKNALDWALPKQALRSDKAFGEISVENVDYMHVLLRLPLRLSGEGVQLLRSDSFSTSEDKHLLVKNMADEAARAILFLKSLERVKFEVLGEDGIETIEDIEITPNPVEFRDFLACVEAQGLKHILGPLNYTMAQLSLRIFH